eukprot:883001_1
MDKEYRHELLVYGTLRRLKLPIEVVDLCLKFTFNHFLYKFLPINWHINHDDGFRSILLDADPIYSGIHCWRMNVFVKFLNAKLFYGICLSNQIKSASSFKDLPISGIICDPFFKQMKWQ